MDQNGWANALDQFWGDLEPGSRALMMLERSLLNDVAGYVGESFASGEESEDDFISAVKTYLRGKSHRTWMPEPFGPERVPRFLLQIGIQVYAASKMEADPKGNYTDRAYHVQLDTLLGERLSKRRFNMNDQANWHQELWRERLMEWVAHKRLRLSLPQDGVGNRNHIQLPLSQMVLRANDLQQLPAFFVKANFQPTNHSADEEFDESQLDRIRSQLSRWRGDSGCFSGWARNVLKDDYKFGVAVNQIEESLRTWDGRFWLPPVRVRAGKAKKPTRWVWISIQSKRRRIRGVSGAVSSSAKLISTADLALLFSGEAVGRDRIEVHDGLTLFRYDENDAAFKQALFVDSGDRGLIVAGPRFKRNLNQLLAGDDIYHSPRLFVAEDYEDYERLDGVPDGCVLFEFRVADRLPAVSSIPDLWRPFLRLPPAGLSLSGGLRIGQEDHFVAGAGPQLKIAGNFLPTFILIDGQKVSIKSRTIRFDQFSEAGEHEIIACFDGKRISKRFRVSRPSNALSVDFPNVGWGFESENWPFWTSEPAVKTSANVTESCNSQRFFGVRGEGLEITNSQPSDSINDRLIAIRLLAGIHLRGASDARPKHPLARQLLVQYAESTKERVTT